MILESNPSMVLEAMYSEEADIVSFNQYLVTPDNLIALAKVGLDFANRQVINSEKWVIKDDMLLSSLKEVPADTLTHIVDSFPIEVIRNYLK